MTNKRKRAAPPAQLDLLSGQLANILQPPEPAPGVSLPNERYLHVLRCRGKEDARKIACVMIDRQFWVACRYRGEMYEVLVAFSVDVEKEIRAKCDAQFNY